VSSNTIWPHQGEIAELRARCLEKIKHHQDVLDLSMINPDLLPPRYLVDKLLEATSKLNFHRYPVARGSAKLREAFAVKYQKAFGVTLNPESEICITHGSKEATNLFFRLLLKEGDSVLLPSPTYPIFYSAARAISAKISFYEIDLDSEDETLRSITEEISAANPKLVVLNSPNNPTGVVFSQQLLEKILALLPKETMVINDFAYGEMALLPYQATSLLAFRDKYRHLKLVECYTLSKAYSVPGWRIGAILGDSEIVGAISRYKSDFDYGAFLPLQIAAASALNAQQNFPKDAAEIYNYRGKLLSEALLGSGYLVHKMQAGASLWLGLPQNLSDIALSQELLEKDNILVMPGRFFKDRYQSNQVEYIRVALVASEERLRHLALILKKYA
jgi:alanine-synthesizing transaminase